MNILASYSKVKCVIPLVLLFCLSQTIVNGQGYPVSAIPDSLKQDAHLVIRDLSISIEVKSPGESTETVKKAITVLDREGEKNAYLVLNYDKFKSVKISQINFYTGAGKKIRSVKQSEIMDIPAFSSFELFSDNRVKAFKPDNSELPYTIEYIYETGERNQISFGRWMPAGDYSQAVQHASITITHPSTIKINRKVVGSQITYSSSGDGKLNEKWELINFRAVSDEPFDGGITERSPSVYLMPSQLEYSGYSGKADTWNEYGSWVYDLFKGRGDLPLEENIAITNIIKETPDTLELIKKLYKRLQGNTRYVAVTLGIGGHQPYDVQTVLKTGYGECKALSNYMYSMLKFAGIKAFPALVSAGKYPSPIFRDFPNFSQFNHVIVCVPGSNDTIWLECTDQKIPFGFLGDFTDNRDALLITPSGGILARTTRYAAEVNTLSGYHEFRVDSAGSVSFTSKIRYAGLQYDDIIPLLRATPDDQKKWLYSNSSLPSLKIAGYTIEETPDRIPSATVTITGTSKGYCSFSGKYMVLPLNFVNPQKPLEKMLRTRQSEVVIRQADIDSDTVIFSLPRNFRIESLPKGRAVTSRFGNYNTSVTTEVDRLIFTRRFEVKPGRYKPSEYRQLFDFMLSVSKGDNLKVLLVPR